LLFTIKFNQACVYEELGPVVGNWFNGSLPEKFFPENKIIIVKWIVRSFYE